MHIDHQAGENCEESVGFALGAASRKLAKFYVKALAGQHFLPSQMFLLRQLWFSARK